MLEILSIIILLLIFVISLFFIYRFIPSKKNSMNNQSNTKKTPNEPIQTSQSKKTKKQKKNQKNPVLDSDFKTNVDENTEMAFQNVEDSPKKDIVIHENPEVKSEVIEEIHQSKESACYSKLGTDDTPSDENNIHINQLTRQIKVFETENNKLNIQLEEAKEESVRLKQEANSLKEENKNIKSKISKLERSQTKNEEKSKKTEKSLSDSLTKTVEMEKNFAKLNAENAEFKSNLTSLTSRLNKTESDLNSEREKMARYQIEKEHELKKYEDLLAKCKVDEVNHKNMYMRYEDTICKLRDENNKIGSDFSGLRNMVTEKTDQVQKLHSNLAEITTLCDQIKGDNLTISQRYSTVCDELNAKIALLESNEIERARLSDQIEHLKPELLSKGDIQNKLQEVILESEKKDSIINDLKLTVSVLKNEIENVSQGIILKNDELSIDLIDLKQQLEHKNAELASFEEQNLALMSEIKTMSTDVHRKNEELEAKLMKLCQELKEKDFDLSTLQDHKLQLLKDIEHLKQDMAGKNEEILTASDLKKQHDEVMKQLLFEKSNFQSKLDSLKKELNAREEKLAKMNENLNSSEKEKLIFADTIQQLRKQLSEIEAQRTASFHDNVEEVIVETRQKSELQAAGVCLANDNGSSAANDLQCHIRKLETELLVLQRKYFDLKNANLTADIAEDHLASKPASKHIVYHQSETVSIPPVVDKHADQSLDAGAEKTSEAHTHLLESIERLNAEISQQRVKNQDLQSSFNDTSSKRVLLQTEHSQLLERHNDVCSKYETLLAEFGALRDSTSTRNNAVPDEAVRSLETQLINLKEENRQLVGQLENYRETLQKTEFCLQNIQASVDQEENNWKNCLKSSEEEQERLEQKIKELLSQIDDLRSKKDSESPIPVTVSDDAPPVLNGSLSSETKKKKKRKNKKKKNKARVASTTQS